MHGIVSYGVYIPKYRIKASDIAGVWKKDGLAIEDSFKITEKSVPGFDEDTITMALEASMEALMVGGIPPSSIQSVFLGSESHPYAVKPSSTIIGEYLGIGNNYFAADLEFACKAATAGMQITCGFLGSKEISYGLIAGSDTAQSKPRNALEYTAGSAACAMVLGDKEKEVVAKVLFMSSFSSDTPDFWRRDSIKYPSHFGRFTGEPAYFHHVMSEAKILFTKSGLSPSDFSYCVFHMPNGKFPQIVAKKLGFTKEQLAPSLTVPAIGNPYSASALIGLASVLDIAKPNEKIFLVSYGSGAGSDGFIFQTTPAILGLQKKITPVKDKVGKKSYISYIDYLKQTHII